MARKNNILFEAGDNKITIGVEGGLCGIWLSNPKGTLGLIAQDDVAPYIVTYEESNPQPKVAITPFGIQIDSPNGPRLISIDDLDKAT